VTSSRALRVLSAVSLAWGTALLVRPRPVVAALAPEYPPDRDWVVRLLGGRLVAQHGVLLPAPDRTLAFAGAAVDALHALSMLPVARLPRYRRAALISAGTTAATGVLTAVLAGRDQGS
jgi:hypothetical protein